MFKVLVLSCLARTCRKVNVGAAHVQGLTFFLEHYLLQKRAVSRMQVPAAAAHMCWSWSFELVRWCWLSATAALIRVVRGCGVLSELIE